MLPDSGGIQEHEVEMLNRRFQRRGRRPVEPIYTAADAADCMRLFSKVKYDDWIDVAKGVRARWWDAGHIVGSASIEMEIAGEGGPTRLLFSGDIGPGHSDFVGDPTAPSGLDHLIMESTYGKTERPVLTTADRRRVLAQEVAAAHALGGPLVIPAFAVERTQELITDLLAVMRDGSAPSGPIFLDSPLAVKATEVFLERGWNPAAGENPFSPLKSSGQLHTTESVDESKALERVTGWHVIVAASGMCDAGRIRHHLKRLLWRPQATVMLVGYQATGTLGRLLQNGQRHVRIQGEDIRVRAAIRSLQAYSGHADAPALAAWAKARMPIAGQIFLVHGEPDSRQALTQRLVEAGVAAATINAPEIDDSFSLAGRACEPVGETHRLAAGAAGAPDWHNARAQLLLDLDETLENAPDDAARRALLGRLRTAIEAPPGAPAA
jgi:metallo-beta-lactamase family protein